MSPASTNLHPATGTRLRRAGATGRLFHVLVKISRPHLALLLCISALLGMAEEGMHSVLAPRAVLALAAAVAFFVHAAALNDIFDSAVDGLNRLRDRPLVSGRGSRKQYVCVALGSGVAAAGLAFSLSLEAGAVLLAGMALSAAYSVPPVRLCARGVVTTALLPIFWVAVPFVIGALAAGSGLAPHTLAVLSGLYIVFAGRIMLKDFRDVAADALYRKRTFVLRYGRATTCAASGAAWIAGSAGLVLVTASPATALALTVYAGGAVLGLRALEHHRGGVAERHLIAAIVKLGQGVFLAVLVAASTASPVKELIGQLAVLACVAAGSLESVRASRLVAGSEVTPAPSRAPFIVTDCPVGDSLAQS
jgi:4-hydroxybenzoate polyprenyltransferase